MDNPYPPLKAHDIGPNVPRRGNRVTRWIGRRILAMLGFKITGSVPNESKMIVVGAPHTSNWDGIMAIGVGMALSINVKVIAKKEMLRFPFAGLFRWMGVIGIDRKAAGGVVGETAALFEQYEQLYVCISPEGSRNNVEKWKSGYHRIALAASVPIMVLVFDWGAGEFRFADHFMPSSDYAADEARILSHFDGVQGRIPEYMSAPIKRQSEGTPGR